MDVFVLEFVFASVTVVLAPEADVAVVPLGGLGNGGGVIFIWSRLWQ